MNCSVCPHLLSAEHEIKRLKAQIEHKDRDISLLLDGFMDEAVKVKDLVKMMGEKKE